VINQTPGITVPDGAVVPFISATPDSNSSDFNTIVNGQVILPFSGKYIVSWQLNVTIPPPPPPPPVAPQFTEVQFTLGLSASTPATNPGTGQSSAGTIVLTSDIGFIQTTGQFIITATTGSELALFNTSKMDVQLMSPIGNVGNFLIQVL